MIYPSIFYFELSHKNKQESESFKKAQRNAAQEYPSHKLHEIIHEKFRLICLADSIEEILFETQSEIGVFFGSIKNLDQINKAIIENSSEHTLKPSSNIPEVVLNLYKIFDDKAFNLINGLFAYVIYDKSSNQLKIFIDRFGINFCYFFSDEQGIRGSSSLNFLLSTGIQREFCKEGIDDFLSYRITQPPLTLIKDVYKVPQGHSLAYSDELVLSPYLKFKDTANNNHDDQFYIDRFADDFKYAVYDAFEMPNPCFTLSGGVDSSVIAKLASNYAPDQINTFNLSVGKKNYKDEFFSKKIADHLGTNHHVVKLTDEDLSDQDFFNLCINLIDEPTVNSYPNEIKLNLEASKDFNTTVYGSMAAQAYFEGYYWKDALDEKTYPLKKIYRLIYKKIQLINLFSGRMSLLKKFLLRVMTSLKSRALEKPEKIEDANRLYTDYLKKEIYSEDFFHEVSKKPKSKAIDLFNNLKLSNDVNRAMYTEYYCMSLARNSLFNSMHQKFIHFFYYPYLDTKFADHNLENPAHLKLEKIIAKKAFASNDLNPSFQRDRQGMSISYEWLGDELKEWVENILLDNEHPIDALFNKESIEFMIKAHSEKRYDFGAYLWALVTLKQWAINKKIYLTK